MKTIFLHIGTHKTATSAIQIFLREHVGELAESGFLFPETGHAPGTKGHHQLAWSLMPDASTKNKVADVSSQELFERLRTEIGQSDCSNVLLSSEELCLLDIESPVTPNTIKKLAQYLDGFKIRVIVYVRRQDEYLSAMYNQVHKSGIGLEITDRTFAGIRATLGNVMQYDLLLEKWAQVFGEKNIIVRAFESQQQPNGIVQDFLDACGIPLQASEVEYENISLSDDMLAYQKLIDDYPAPEKSRRALLPLLKNTSITRPRTPVPAREMRDIVLSYADCNSRVAKIYLEREDGELFYSALPDPDEPWEPYPGLTTEKAVQISGVLIGETFREMRRLSRNIKEQSRMQDRDLRLALWRQKRKGFSWKKALYKILRLEERLIKKSGLFDPVFYNNTYPDVSSSGMEPITYFVYHGILEGHNPSSSFKTEEYILANPDVAVNGINPLIHYIQSSHSEQDTSKQPSSSG